MNFLTSVWAAVGPKLAVIGAGLVTFMAMVFQIKRLKKKVEKEERRADSAEARATEAEDINELDTELDHKYADIKREAIDDVQDGKMPDVIRNRNRRRSG